MPFYREYDLISDVNKQALFQTPEHNKSHFSQMATAPQRSGLVHLCMRNVRYILFSIVFVALIVIVFWRR